MPFERDLHAGAELLQFGGLLVDVDIDAVPDQRQRGGQPADAAADDRNALVCRHAAQSTLSCPALCRASTPDYPNESRGWPGIRSSKATHVCRTAMPGHDGDGPMSPLGFSSR